jgi:hypothetical protein
LKWLSSFNYVIIAYLEEPVDKVSQQNKDCWIRVVKIKGPLVQIKTFLLNFIVEISSKAIIYVSKYVFEFYISASSSTQMPLWPWNNAHASGTSVAEWLRLPERPITVALHWVWPLLCQCDLKSNKTNKQECTNRTPFTSKAAKMQYNLFRLPAPLVHVKQNNGKF